MESHTILLMVSRDTDVLAVRVDEESNEETSKRILSVPKGFKRPLLTHRSMITTGWKRVGKVSRDNTKAGNRYWRTTWRRM